jgi:DHA1 family tetracycline resistance protein-like MFS transporter
MPRFSHRAVPIVLAVTIDVIGFGIVMPVLPALVTHLGHIIAVGTRKAVAAGNADVAPSRE